MSEHDVRLQQLHAWLAGQLPKLFAERGWGAVPPAELTAGSTGMPPAAGPILPVLPPPPTAPWLPASEPVTSSQIFAGPYGQHAPAPAPGGGG